MRYFLEPITLTQIILHAIPKKDCVKFWADHPLCLNIDEKEYLRLKATDTDVPDYIRKSLTYKMSINTPPGKSE